MPSVLGTASLSLIFQKRKPWPCWNCFPRRLSEMCRFLWPWFLDLVSLWCTVYLESTFVLAWMSHLVHCAFMSALLSCFPNNFIRFSVFFISCALVWFFFSISSPLLNSSFILCWLSSFIQLFVFSWNSFRILSSLISFHALTVTLPHSLGSPVCWWILLRYQ